MNNRRVCLTTTALAASMLITQPALAQQPTVGSGDWYYRMGGAAPISPAPNINAAASLIPGSEGLEVPQSCGSFDPFTAISSNLGDVAGGVDQLDDILILAATEAIAALPAIILQRANPGLYNHFQNALGKAEELFDRSVQSCERIVEETSASQNPLEDWVNIAKRETYQRLISEEEDADSIEVEEEANDTNGDEGVVWVAGERKGGLDQPPIEINRDVAEAGYNVIAGQEVGSEAAPAAAEGLRLVDLFTTPQEAGDFATEVLGDHNVETCEGCTSSTTAGVGLEPTYARERDTINEALAAIAAADTPIDLVALEEVSSANVVVTPQVLETLRGIEDDQDRGVLVARLASDIATSKTLERAFSLRRLLYSGRKVPEVAAHGLALEHVEETLVELDHEITRFRYEDEVQSELASATAALILQEGERLSNSAVATPDARRGDDGGNIRRGQVQ